MKDLNTEQRYILETLDQVTKSYSSSVFEFVKFGAPKTPDESKIVACGTGFVAGVDDFAFIITAYHVIEQKPALRIGDKAITEYKYIAFQNRDIAIIPLEGNHAISHAMNADLAFFISSTKERPSDKLYIVMGYPTSQNKNKPKHNKAYNIKSKLKAATTHITDPVETDCTIPEKLFLKYCRKDAFKTDGSMGTMVAAHGLSGGPVIEINFDYKKDLDPPVFITTPIIVGIAVWWEPTSNAIISSPVDQPLIRAAREMWANRSLE